MNNFDNIKNQILIPFDNDYKFNLIESKETNFMHPISDYFLVVNDLSVNVVISLKWIEWAYVFFDSLKKELLLLKKDYSSNHFFLESLQYKNLNLPEENHILFLNDKKILNRNDFDNFFKNHFFKDLSNSNSKIHFKLKINIREFLLLSYIFSATFINEK